MNFIPASLTLTNRKCLIVGCHPAAITIANDLCAQSAQVAVIGECENGLLASGVVNHRRNFEISDLEECWLVVAAGDSQSENDNVISQCESRQIFCYAPGNSESSTWQPSVLASEDTSLSHNQHTENGMVSLVGAGPGHPELLTIRALRLIQTADAIVHDRLVSDAILALCNRKAEFIYAGKAKANHALPQESINALLAELARKHKNVVRLKGGDPFIFGRGGEEIETLADAGVPFQIVPGITAASGCAAFAGIPLTHRDHAQSCIFVTGHLRNGKINLNWQELKEPTQTIVVYMSLTGLDLICRTLIDIGRARNTPAALVERGTKPEQRVLSGTLESLPALIAANEVTAPTLLIIGGVVSLRDKLQWF